MDFAKAGVALEIPISLAIVKIANEISDHSRVLIHQLEIPFGD